MFIICPESTWYLCCLLGEELLVDVQFDEEDK